MKEITCYVCSLKPGLDLPEEPLKLAGTPVEEYIRKASSNGDDPAIDLQLDYQSRRTWGQIGASDETNTVALHKALRKTTLNGWAADTVVDRVALIIADRWQNEHDILGMMFDVGFRPESYPELVQSVGKSHHRVPREGCAIFLKPLMKLRGGEPGQPPPTAYRQEVAYTAAHELGHLFNLWHLGNPNDPASQTFMTQSKASGVHSNWCFAEEHRTFLTQDENPEYVHPGGSKFGERGNHGPEADSPYNRPPARSGLRLSVSIAQEECWPFEPLELDVRLSLSRRRRRGLRIPDQVDPGYEAFQIWVERPDGERFRYRSPRRYCQNLGSMVLKPGEAYERDVSIFAQAGGYTFSQPGTYRVRAMLLLPNGTRLTSNRAEIAVRAARPGNAEYRQLRDLLAAPYSARLLYHRAGYPWKRVVEPLEELARAPGTSPELRCNLHYALGRFLHSAGRRRSTAVRKRYLQKSYRWLSEALENPTLSRGRRRRASRLVRRLAPT